MANATIQDIINEVRKDLDDIADPIANVKYSDARMLRALNLFGAKVKSLGEDKAISTDISLVAGTASYAYPTNYWFPVAVRYKDSDDYLPITMLRDTNTHELDFLSGNNTGAPRFMFILDKKIYVYPTPDKAYSLSIECVERFTKITASDLSEDFLDYFDTDYEQFAIDWMVMTVPKKSDSIAQKTSAAFYAKGGSWDYIRNLESKKFKPFNAKTRRTDGVQGTNYMPDYFRY